MKCSNTLTMILAAGLSLALAACATPETSGTAPAAPPATATLTLTSVTPASGSDVRPDDTIKADLDYTLANFTPDRYFLTAEAETGDGSTIGWAAAEQGPDPALAAANGPAHIEVPMEYARNVPDIKQPFMLWFCINEKTGPTSSRLIASARPVQYVPK